MDAASDMHGWGLLYAFPDVHKPAATASNGSHIMNRPTDPYSSTLQTTRANVYNDNAADTEDIGADFSDLDETDGETHDRTSSRRFSLSDYEVVEWISGDCSDDYAERRCTSLDIDSHGAVHNNITSRTSSVNGLNAVPIDSSSVSAVSSVPQLRPHQPKKGTSDNSLESAVAAVDQTAEAVKTKLLSVWTNVKNGWVVKTTSNFKRDSAICLLGRIYYCHKHDSQTDDNRDSPRRTDSPNDSFRQFKIDFRTRIWLTYRNDFPMLEGSNLTSDVGWGCMIRCGQMLLAQCLVAHFLGRDWRLPSLSAQSHDYRTATHRQIVHFFGDLPNSSECPFSIHRLVSIGRQLCDKNAGDWYGPVSIVSVLREALQQSPLGESLAMYIAVDGTVFINDVLDTCSRSSNIFPHSFTADLQRIPQFACSTDAFATCENVPGGNDATAHVSHNPFSWIPVIILIPVKLGSEVLNMDYLPCLKQLLRHDLCVGIIGGRPKHSLYFIGWQDDKLLHLDPHCCQDVVDVLPEDFPLKTFHCTLPRTMSASKLDPSCCIGFYCHNRQEFNQLVNDTRQIVHLSERPDVYPMFTFKDGRQEDEELRTTLQHHRSVDAAKRIRAHAVLGDDFAIL